MSNLKVVTQNTESYTGVVILKDTWFTQLAVVSVDGEDYALGIVGAYTEAEAGNLALLDPEHLQEVA